MPKSSKQRVKRRTTPYPQRVRNTRNPSTAVPGYGNRHYPVLVYNPPLRYSLPLPRMFVTRFWCEADYKVPIATASTFGGTVKMNSAWLPFRPGGSTAFSGLTFLGPAAETTLQPTGFSNVFGASSTLYGSGKVIEAKCCVRYVGSNSGNNTTCVVLPIINVQPATDIYHARTYPFVKEGTFSVSKPNTPRDWLCNTVNPTEYLGLSSIESKAIQFGQQFSFGLDPQVVVLWQILFQTNDLDVTSTSADLLQVRLEYQVECQSLGELDVT